MRIWSKFLFFKLYFYWNAANLIQDIPAICAKKKQKISTAFKITAVRNIQRMPKYFVHADIFWRLDLKSINTRNFIRRIKTIRE